MKSRTLFLLNDLFVFNLNCLLCALCAKKVFFVRKIAIITHMKIAVFGGSGFIGTALVNDLKREYEGPEDKIIIFDTVPSAVHSNDYQYCDITDKRHVIDVLQGFDVIYNLAAEHRDDVKPVQKYYDTNVNGAENICAAAQTHRIRHIIFTSTVAVYGLNNGESIETDTPEPFNDYGQSKFDAESVYNAWADTETANTLITVRLVATFGPGNRGNIYNLIRQIAHNRFIMIGRGMNRKSIAYVENVSAFLMHCMKQAAETDHKTKISVYNYADKPDIPMHAFVNKIRALCGKRPMRFALPIGVGLLAGMVFDVLAAFTRRTFPISRIRIEKFTADTVVNSDKAHKIFTPPVTLEDGLERMIAREFKHLQ